MPETRTLIQYFILLATCSLLFLGNSRCKRNDWSVVPYVGGPPDEVIAAYAHAYQDSGIDAATPYTEAPGVHQVLIYHLDNPGIAHPYNEILPAGWVPQTVAAVELVAYIGHEDTLLVEACPYGWITPSTYIFRLRFSRKVELYSAHDGVLLQERAIEGSLPDDCPASTTHNYDIYGDHILNKDIIAWLKPYVER